MTRTLQETLALRDKLKSIETSLDVIYYEIYSYEREPNNATVSRAIKNKIERLKLMYRYISFLAYNYNLLEPGDG